MEFIGFPRPDGSVGIRNHVIVSGLGLAGSAVSQGVLELISETVAHIAHLEDRISLTQILRHPNVAGMVVVGAGLEQDESRALGVELERTGKPYKVMDIGDIGYTGAVAEAAEAAAEIVREASSQRRVLNRLSKLLPAFVEVSVTLMADVFPGYTQWWFRENGRCLWIPKKSQAQSKKGGGVNLLWAGEFNAAKIPDPHPGLYRYSGPEKTNATWEAILASGSQLLIGPAGEASYTGHPLVPALCVALEAGVAGKVAYDLDLSGAVDGALSIEDIGLLTLSEILSTASGKYTKKEVFRDRLFASP